MRMLYARYLLSPYICLLRDARPRLIPIPVKVRKFSRTPEGLKGALKMCFLSKAAVRALFFFFQACSENANVFFFFTPYLSNGGFSERKFDFNSFSKMYRKDFSGHKLIFILRKRTRNVCLIRKAVFRALFFLAA